MSVWSSQISGKTIEDNGNRSWLDQINVEPIVQVIWDLTENKINFFSGLVESRNVSYIWTLPVFEESLLGHQSAVWHLICGWTINRKGAMWKVINTNEWVQRWKLRGDGKETGKRHRKMIWNTQDKKRKWKKCKNFTRRQTGREGTKQKMAMRLTHYRLTQHASESQMSQMWRRGHHTPKEGSFISQHWSHWSHCCLDWESAWRSVRHQAPMCICTRTNICIHLTHLKLLKSS